MKSSIFLLSFLFISSAFATQCTNLLLRREWRLLSDKERSSYIDAVKCLQKLPASSKEGMPGAISRFDEFEATHIIQTDSVHFVGHFQPWHRYFLATYEKALREECGYTGAQPYWDWTLDATLEANILRSPVFRSQGGFGGNGPYTEKGFEAAPFDIPGRTGGGCIKDGPFKDLRLHVGPGYSVEPNDYCLTRDINPSFMMRTLNWTVVARTLLQPTFEKFDIALQGGISLDTFTTHAGGHLGVGGKFGTIADVYSSPGDPLFFLHHANLDRLWYIWQHLNPFTRFKDISGPTVKFGPPFGDTPNFKNVTLKYPLNLGKLAPEVTIADVMHTDAGPLCYMYL